MGRTVAELEQTITIVELNEWFAFWGLEKWEKVIKTKEMTAEQQTDAILAGFGSASS